VVNQTDKIEPAGVSKTRYVMIGGFLGAGKTTAVEKLGLHLQKRGLRVGLITNDQGKDLVDTTTLRSRGFAIEEIQGGCFCCQFDSLAEAASRLRDTSEPDVLIAEPVGSCTDLIATVSYPLRRLFGDRFSFAPLSVLVDPIRAARVFGLETGGKFSDKVAYIYKKQIEEADLLVINKSDLISASRLARLTDMLAEHARHATVLSASARTGAGLDEWFDRIMRAELSNREVMSVDYNIYAEGEALLAWLNCTVRLSSVRYFDAGKVLTDLATCMQSILQQEGAEVAHLKITLTPSHDAGEIAAINLVRNDHVPEVGHSLSEPVQSGELILNLRAEADPEVLHSAATRALLALMEKSPDLFARMEHCEHFRPSKPLPTHRIPPVALQA